MSNDNESNKYLEMLSQDRYLDKIYGTRKDNGGFMIGNSPIDLEGSFIDVNGMKFAKTYGLLELLITKQPTESQITNMIWRIIGKYLKYRQHIRDAMTVMKKFVLITATNSNTSLLPCLRNKVLVY